MIYTSGGRHKCKITLIHLQAICDNPTSPKSKLGSVFIHRSNCYLYYLHFVTINPASFLLLFWLTSWGRRHVILRARYRLVILNTRMHDGPIFKMDTPKSNIYARSTSYMSRQIWNALPSYIRLIDSYEHFKLAIKRHFNAEYFESAPPPEVNS